MDTRSIRDLGLDQNAAPEMLVELDSRDGVAHIQMAAATSLGRY
jgi:hypothetical protein